MIFEKSWPIPLTREDTCEFDMVQAKILTATIDKLEAEKDSLMNTVSDLRQLIKRIALQQEREAQRRKNHTKDLETEVARLQNALKVSETHSSHFSSMSQYWKDFL
jgi:septal ring factor EnvC (AmiA/AmiB activator)